MAGSSEITEGSYRSWYEGGRIIDQSAGVLQTNHRITCIVEPLGAVFDSKDAVLEVLAIGFDCGRINVRAG